MGAMASEITSVQIVYSTVCSGHRSKKTPKLRVTSLNEGNSQWTGKFPSQKLSNAENASIWLRHHVYSLSGNIPDVTDIEEYVFPFFRGDDCFWGVQQGELLCFIEHGD